MAGRKEVAVSAEYTAYHYILTALGFVAVVLGVWFIWLISHFEYERKRAEREEEDERRRQDVEAFRATLIEQMKLKRGQSVRLQRVKINPRQPWPFPVGRPDTIETNNGASSEPPRTADNLPVGSPDGAPPYSQH